MPVSIRTLSQLPEVSALNPAAIFEVGAPISVAITDVGPTWKYQSCKITKENLDKNTISAVRHDFWNVNHLPDNMDFTALCDTVSSIADGDFNFVGDKTFSNDPKIDNSPLTTFSLVDGELDEYSVNYGTLKKYASINSAPVLNPSYGFVTHLSGYTGGGELSDRYLNIFKIEDDGSAKTIENQANFVLDSEAKKIAQMEYVFKIPPKGRFSNEWTAPASGIFTCYGWLDEINNPAQSNESRWVALLGWQNQLKVWSILQVQPFIKNNYLSYVGFTFPVKRGMRLKIQTGFAVGSNSDKYFASNSSLANHMANAFLGGVYTGLSVDNAEGVDYDYADVSKNYALSSDLSNYVTLLSGEYYATSAFALIDELSSKLSNIIDTDPDDPNPQPIVGANKVNYIDAPNLSGDYPFLYSIASFGKGMNYGVFNDSVSQSSVIDGQMSSYKCLSVSFDVDPNNVFSYKNYYSPPPHSEIFNERTGIVERAFFSELLPAGRIASDGKFFYYKASTDCTLLLNQMTDVASPGVEIVKAWMLVDTNRGIANIKCVPILEKVQCAWYNGRPYVSTSIPVKAGTIIMVGIYIRERIEPSMPYFMEQLQPPVIAGGGTEAISYFSEIANYALSHPPGDKPTKSSEYYQHKYMTSDDREVTRYAGLLWADGSNISDWYGDGSSQKHIWPMPSDPNSDSGFGIAFYVYELP